MNESFDHLIDELSDSLEPVKPFLKARWRLILWLVSTLVISAAMVLWLKLDGFVRFKEFMSWDTLFFIMSLIPLAYCLFLSFVPGALSRKRLYLSFVPLIGFMIYLGVHWFGESDPLYRGNYLCEVDMMILSLVPMVHLYYFYTRGTYAFGASSMLSGSVSILIPAMIMHFVCPLNYGHIITYHVSTVFAVTFIVAPVLFKLMDFLRSKFV